MTVPEHITDERLGQMLAAAEKATPGERRLTKFNGIPNAVMVPHPDFGGMAICTLAVHHDIHGNAEFLRLTDPVTIAALIAEVKAARAAETYASKFLVSFVNRYCDPIDDWSPLPDLIGMLTQIDNASTVAGDLKAQRDAMAADLLAAGGELSSLRAALSTIVEEIRPSGYSGHQCMEIARNALALTELQHRRAESDNPLISYEGAQFEDEAGNLLVVVRADQAGGTREVIKGAVGRETVGWPDEIDHIPAATPPASGVRVKALADVAAERQRQMDVEGWMPEHDDTHRHGEMAIAAAAYAINAGDPFRHYTIYEIPSHLLAVAIWPWDLSWLKDGDTKRRKYVKAAALLVAEIERLDRQSAIEEHA